MGKDSAIGDEQWEQRACFLLLDVRDTINNLAEFATSDAIEAARLTAAGYTTIINKLVDESSHHVDKM